MQKAIKRAFTRDILVKLAALALATGVLLTVLYLRFDTQRISGVAIRMIRIPDYLTLESQSLKEVNIDVRGPKDQLRHIAADRVKIEIPVSPSDIDFSGIAPNAPKRSVTARFPLSRPSVKFVIPQPAERFVDVVKDPLRETVVECQFLVHTAEIRVATPSLRQNASLPPCYVGPYQYVDAAEIEMEPKTLLVRGSPETLDALKNGVLPLSDKWLAVSCGENDPEQIMEIPYTVDFAEAEVEPFKDTPKTVLARFYVERTDDTREFEVQVQRGKISMDLVAGRRMVYEPNKVRVTLEGRTRVLDGVKPEQIEVRFDIAKALAQSPEPVDVEYTVTTPKDLDVRVVGRNPETIRVTITDVEVDQGAQEGQSEGTAP